MGKWSIFLARARRDKFLYALALPGLFYFVFFKYVPIAGIAISFQNYNPFLGFWGSKWVGFEHYLRFFSHEDFWILMRNTLAINTLNLLFFFPAPILLSLMLNELRKEAFKRVIQSIVYLPHFLSWVIIAGLTFLLLSQSQGIVNKLIVSFGGETIPFLMDPDYFWLLITLQSMWKDAGWGTIIFLAAMANLDPQLYEAAKMDGAGRYRQAWHITLPGIRNVILILLILRLGHVMDVGFEQVYLMMNAAVSNVADVFDTYVYRVGIREAQFSYSTAIGVFKSVVGIILVVAANRLTKRFGEEGVY